MSSFRKNSLFNDLSDEQIGFIEKKLIRRDFKEGDIIISENSVGNSMYLLIKGEIMIEKELVPVVEGFKTNPEDKKVIKIDDTMNYFFGEMSLFDPALKRTASITAVTGVEVAELNDIEFDKIITERKDIGVIILKNIGLKLSRLLDNSNVELSKMITAFTLSLKL